MKESYGTEMKKKKKKKRRQTQLDYRIEVQKIIKKKKG